jgi:hypothetical protein
VSGHKNTVCDTVPVTYADPAHMRFLLFHHLPVKGVEINRKT